jgi:hypothetical protein
MKRSNLANCVLLLVASGGISLCWADEPVAWGIPAGAKGCVIFREYEKLDVVTSRDGTRTTGKSHFELSVVSSDGYTLSKATWADDQAALDELQRIAITDQTRFVKLKDHYSPQDLEAAQSLCREAMTPLQ